MTDLLCEVVSKPYATDFSRVQQEGGREVERGK